MNDKDCFIKEKSLKYPIILRKQVVDINQFKCFTCLVKKYDFIIVSKTHYSAAVEIKLIRQDVNKLYLHNCLIRIK